VSIIAETQGLFDTIQDAGRPGYRSFGVPLGGWFDADSAARANVLAGNDPQAPCLEITLRSGRYRVMARIGLAIAGPGSVIEVIRCDGVVHTWSDSIATILSPGDTFCIHHPVRGLRSYVAVTGGGWAGPSILGSVSTEQRVFPGMRLRPRFESITGIPWMMLRSLAPWRTSDQANSRDLSFVASSEFDRSANSAEGFASRIWKMSDRSDRVGVRFAVESGTASEFELPLDPVRLSEPVVPGTIQWTGSELIVLGVAGGTMGGYPVIGYLVRSEISVLAQIRPNETVYLRPVSLDTAWRMTDSHDHGLRKALMRIRLAITGR